MKIIILAGGTGTRLWPLSRGKYPKQFIRLNGMEKSILQMTIERCLKLVEMKDIILVTNGEYRQLIAGQMEQLGLQPIHDNILSEPMPKNTLPAIYNGVKHIRSAADDLVAVFPSDHLINDVEGFCDAVHKAESLAESYIVTFGIPATMPETGYGYIQPGRPLGHGFQVNSFKEKPPREVAEEYVKQRYYWNAGMFMFHTGLFNEEVRRYCSEVYMAFQQDDVQKCFEASPSISIDYGVMEHSHRVAVQPMNNDWSDLGSFQAIYEAYSGFRDGQGNVAMGNSIMVDSSNSMVLGNTSKPIALVGMDDTVVIDYDDAALICRRDKAQQVKLVVEELGRRGSKALDMFSTEQRPWGSAALLECGDSYRVRRLTVQPGKAINDHSHLHCTQSWTVVCGRVIARLDGKEKELSAGESVCIRPGQIHGMHNPGNIPAEIIEIQTGDTDDIHWVRP